MKFHMKSYLQNLESNYFLYKINKLLKSNFFKESSIFLNPVTLVILLSAKFNISKFDKQHKFSIFSI